MPPRFKNEGTLTALRDNTDASDAPLRVSELTVSTPPHNEGDVFTSDLNGKGRWAVNAAIELANNAQAAADAAQADATAAQAAADAAQLDATAAQATADAANTAAGVAQATADAAATAAGVADAAAAAAGIAAAAAAATAAAAGVTATAALGAAALAQISADNAQNAAEAAQATADSALTLAQNAYPSDVDLLADDLIFVTGTPTRQVSATYAYNYVTFTTTNLAECYTLRNLKAGTWTFFFHVVTANNQGRVTISVGSNVLADPQDLYTAATVYPVIFTYPGVVIAASGVKDIRFKINGKNGLSAGFAFVPVKFWGLRTGA